MMNFHPENVDETLRKLNGSTLMPSDEIVCKILLEKAIYNPKLVDGVVEIFKKIFGMKTVTSNNLNCTNASSIIKTLIANKLDELLESTGTEAAASTFLFNITNLITKLYQNSIISKLCVNCIIDLIKVYENGNKFDKTYTSILTKALENRKLKRNGSDPKIESYNEMTSSGEWSDFDSETSRHGFLR
jgi:hypothetical protein